jgi:O-methyltransferase involved in polyketide biosynthesis
MDLPDTEPDAPPKVGVERDETLAGVSRTLLIPLYARAHAARLLPEVAFHDPAAQTLAGRLALDTRAVGRDRFTMRLCIARSVVLERELRALLATAARPRSVVILACGLDTLPQRVGTERACWLCADLPAVTALRDRLLPPVQDVAHASAALPDGLAALAGQLGAGRPVFLLEGILPYLDHAQVTATLRGLADLAPQGADLLVDGYHPALLAFARFGDGFRRMRVRFRFGIADTRDYVQLAPDLAPRLRHRGETDLLALLPWHRRLRTAVPALGAAGRPLATIAHLELMPA